LRDETQTTPIDEGCGMDFSPRDIDQGGGSSRPKMSLVAHHICSEIDWAIACMLGLVVGYRPIKD
jgi:hypothetical protein